jgi:hypothetical protein
MTSRDDGQVLARTSRQVPQHQAVGLAPAQQHRGDQRRRAAHLDLGARSGVTPLRADQAVVRRPVVAVARVVRRG